MKYPCYGIAIGTRGITQVELDLTVSIKAMLNEPEFASYTRVVNGQTSSGPNSNLTQKHKLEPEN